MIVKSKCWESIVCERFNWRVEAAQTMVWRSESIAK